MDKEKRVIISTFFEGSAVKVAISKLSPDKLILLIDEPTDSKKKETMHQKISQLKDFFKGTLTIDTHKIHSYNIAGIMGDVIKIIDKESKDGNKILIHLTEGRKPTSLATLFATYLRKNKIEGAYYITEEEHDIIKLPSLTFQINETKKSFLKEISKGNKDFLKIGKKLGLKVSSTYQNMQEMKEEGYIENNKELKLTDLGGIMIL